VALEEIIEMPHRRSRGARTRRLLRRLIIHSAYYDPEKRELINTLDSRELLRLASKHSKKIHVGLITQFEQGEVLVDPYGRGTFQRRVWT